MSLKKASLYLIGILILLYLPAAHNQFNMDAGIYLSGQRAPAFAKWQDYFTKSVSQHYAPVNNLLNIHLFQWLGSDPWPYRAVNLALFALNNILLLVLFRRLFRNWSVVLYAVLFFTIHPLNTEILHHVTTNTVWLMSIFMLLGLLALDEWARTKRNFFFIAALAAHIVALASQEFALVLPFYVFLILKMKHQWKWDKTAFATLPFAVISLAYLFVWHALAGGQAQLLGKAHDLHLSAGSYTATLFQLFCWYVRNLISPDAVVFIFNLWPARHGLWLLNTLLLLTAICVWVLLRNWKSNEKSLALLWFLGGFLIFPVTALAHSYMGLVIEPYWFLFNSTGIFVLAALYLQEVLPRSSFLKKLAVSFFLIYFVLYVQLYLYIQQTPRRHAEFWLKVNPQNYLARFQKADALAQAGQEKLAFRLFKEASHAIGDQDARALFNLGSILDHQKQYKQARGYLERTVKRDPNFVLAYNMIATSYVEEGNFKEAEKYFKKAIAADPNFIIAYLNLADYYLTQKRFREALPLYRHVAENKYAPEYHEEARAKMGLALQALKNKK